MKRKELVQTLELIKPALSKLDVIPMLQNFCFADKTVFASDDTLAIVGPTECEDEFAVHGASLYGLLSSSSAEEVNLKLDGSTAIFKCGKSNSKLPFSPREDFIFSEPSDKWDSVKVTISLIEGIKVCLETVSSDLTQRAFNGITIDRDTLYSSNGDALTRIKLKQAIKSRYLMPTAFCQAMVRTWEALGLAVGTLNFSDKWCYADFDDWRIYGQMLEVDAPPDFDGVIKKSTKGKITTQELPSGFEEALARARVLADPESQKTQLSVEGGKMSLLTETHMGEVHDALVMKGHPDVQANINASYIASAIKVCDRVSFNDRCAVLQKGNDVLMLVSNMN